MRNVIVVLAVLAAMVSAFPKWHQLESYTFEAFLRETGKPYEGEELSRRKEVFNARLKDIKSHNKDNTKTWKRGINQFADWTEAEFRAYQRAKITPRQALGDFMKADYKASPTAALPKTVDYRNRVNPPVLTGIKNQGSCGSCWAHAATETLESYFALRFGQLPVLATQQVTACSMFCDGCGGCGYGLGWLSVAMQGGLNEEWTYPYTNFFAPNMSKQATHKCENISKKFPTITTASGKMVFTWWPKTNVSFARHITVNDAKATMQALALVGPQAISVAASYQWSDYESGVLVNNYSTVAQNISWQEINHAVQLVGYGHDEDLGKNYWIVRNSWGTNYGEQGYIRLDRPAVEPCGNLTGTVICGTSGLLIDPAWAEPALLDRQNGYYF